MSLAGRFNAAGGSLQGGLDLVGARRLIEPGQNAMNQGQRLAQTRLGFSEATRRGACRAGGSLVIAHKNEFPPDLSLRAGSCRVFSAAVFRVWSTCCARPL